MTLPPTIIVAVASPPGRSARGLVRASGVGLLAAAEGWLDARPGTTRRLDLPLRSGMRLPALCTTFVSPRSYTAEDLIELLLPGNPDLLEEAAESLVDAFLRRGHAARRAGPGEFTARAYLNGRIDLIQAEGVAATIAAQSEGELQAARDLLAGRLGVLAESWSSMASALLAAVEAGIDFVDQEDVITVTGGVAAREAAALASSLRRWLATDEGTERRSATARVVLAGPPNAGKSSLFNALLGRERVLRSPLAGTTRDAITEPLALETPAGLVEIVLIDIPGLDGEDPESLDEFGAEGPMGTQTQLAAGAAALSDAQGSLSKPRVGSAACGESHAACNRPRSRMAASPSLAVDSLEYSGATAPCPAEAGTVSATQHFRHRLLAAGLGPDGTMVGAGGASAGDAAHRHRASARLEPSAAFEQGLVPSMQRVARRAIESADIVLCCALAPPWSRMTALSTGDPPALLRILTKADLHPEACCPMGVLRTSAVTGAGLDQLRRRIAERVLERRTARGAELLPISRRAQEALRVAVESLEQAAGLAESGPSERALDAPELVAAALRRALDALGSVSGRVTSDDVLGLVFSRFCIGK